MAKEVLVLRHAEKPDDNDKSDLSQRGRIRAAALALYLPHRFGNPDYLFAARDSVESCRPRLTLTPLSDSAKLPIDCTIADADFAKLASTLGSDQIRTDTTVVVAWHHGHIPLLVKRLGASHTPDT